MRITVVSMGHTQEQAARIGALVDDMVRFREAVPVSVARNAGARTARGDEDLLFFVDDDNVVSRHAARRLAAILRDKPAIVMVGPAQYYLRRPRRLWCAGVRRSPLFMRTFLETDIGRPVPDLAPSEDFPNCFMVRRRDFEAIRGFDEVWFPMHYEEADLARRLMARARGRYAALVPHARVWHDITLSLTRRLHMRDASRAFECARGRAVFTARHGAWLQRFAYLCFGQWAYAAVYCGVAVYRMRRGALGPVVAYWRGMGSGLHVFWNAEARAAPIGRWGVARRHVRPDRAGPALTQQR